MAESERKGYVLGQLVLANILFVVRLLHTTNAELQALAGYHERQDFSWARTTAFMGSKLLQNKGVVVVKHDGSAYVSS